MKWNLFAQNAVIGNVKNSIWKLKTKSLESHWESNLPSTNVTQLKREGKCVFFPSFVFLFDVIPLREIFTLYKITIQTKLNVFTSTIWNENVTSQAHNRQQSMRMGMCLVKCATVDNKRFQWNIKCERKQKHTIIPTTHIFTTTFMNVLSVYCALFVLSYHNFFSSLLLINSKRIKRYGCE